MKNKQLGMLSLATIAWLIGILAAVSIVAGLGYSYGSYKQEVKTERLRSDLVKVSEDLEKSEDQVKELVKENEKLNASVEFLEGVIVINRLAVEEHTAEVTKLNKKIEEMKAKLPKPAPRPKGQVVDQELESRSMARYDVMYESYLEATSPPDPREPAPEVEKKALTELYDEHPEMETELS